VRESYETRKLGWVPRSSAVSLAIIARLTTAAPHERNLPAGTLGERPAAQITVP